MGETLIARKVRIMEAKLQALDIEAIKGEVSNMISKIKASEVDIDIDTIIDSMKEYTDNKLVAIDEKLAIISNSVADKINATAETINGVARNLDSVEQWNNDVSEQFAVLSAKVNELFEHPSIKVYEEEPPEEEPPEEPKAQ